MKKEDSDYIKIDGVNTVIGVDGKARVWTMLFRPFVMGGDTETAISTRVYYYDLQIHHGIPFFRFTTKNGSSRVCEAYSGGIIANDYDELIENLRGCTTRDLAKQIREAAVQANAAKPLEADDFFKYYRH